MSQTEPFRLPRPARWIAANEVRYAHVLRVVADLEGGHSNDAADRGGETNLGVSLRFLKAVGGLDLNHDGLADLDLNFDTVLNGQDIRLMTPDVRYEVFLYHFYAQPGFWTLAPPFDGAMFDQAVNGGTTAAIKILQRALNRISDRGLRLAVDGALGPKTRGRFRSVLETRRSSLLKAIRSEAAIRYRAIVAADPSQAKYLKGWLRRAEALGHA